MIVPNQWEDRSGTIGLERQIGKGQHWATSSRWQREYGVGMCHILA